MNTYARQSRLSRNIAKKSIVRLTSKGEEAVLVKEEDRHSTTYRLTTKFVSDFLDIHSGKGFSRLQI